MYFCPLDWPPLRFPILSNSILWYRSTAIICPSLCTIASTWVILLYWSDLHHSSTASVPISTFVYSISIWDVFLLYELQELVPCVLPFVTVRHFFIWYREDYPAITLTTFFILSTKSLVIKFLSSTQIVLVPTVAGRFLLFSYFLNFLWK